MVINTVTTDNRQQQRVVVEGKRSLARWQDSLTEQFTAMRSMRAILLRQSSLIDGLLKKAWEYTVTDPAISLFAVGGYGRKELHPYSDIDLLIVIPAHASPNQEIVALVTMLWDMGLTVGHSVRTLGECFSLSKKNVSVLTNLMEARWLIGGGCSNEDISDAISAKKMWSARRYFSAKLDEQEKRHTKFHNLVYNLQPNIKEGPGGLRDLHTISWIAKRCFHNHTLEQLLRKKFLTTKEIRELKEAREVLWRIRFALHRLAKRKEDRLLFEYQQQISKQFGYTGDDHERIEKFMHIYYRAAEKIRHANGFILQLLREEIHHAPTKKSTRLELGKYYHIKQGLIHINHSNVFQKNPGELLMLFLHIGKYKKNLDLHPWIFRAIHENLHLISSRYQSSTKYSKIFLEITNTPRVDCALRLMHKSGVLGAYLPVFRRVRGLMQFNLLHTYTVDEHTLNLIQCFADFSKNNDTQLFPFCHKIICSLENISILVLSGLFHDIAKGRDGDHSVLGAVDARKFAITHRLEKYGENLLVWLVENHLLMSMAATRSNLDDPAVIANFAQKIGNLDRLNHLYLLSIADAKATNASLWNAWRASLMSTLYQKTFNALQQRVLDEQIDSMEKIAQTQHGAKDLLKKNHVYTSGTIRALWKILGNDYFLCHTAEETAWHSAALVDLTPKKIPLVLLRTRKRQEATEIFVCLKNRDNLFFVIARSLVQIGLNIVDAKIITLNNGYAADSFIVLEENGESVRKKYRRSEIVRHLKLSLKKTSPPDVSRLSPSHLIYFPSPLKIDFRQDEKNNQTVMHITATGKPGLLFLIGKTLSRCHARIKSARISSYGERAENIFYLTDNRNSLINEPKQLKRIESTLRDLCEKQENPTNTLVLPHD